MYNNFGTRVVLIERQKHILPRFMLNFQIATELYLLTRK